MEPLAVTEQAKRILEQERAASSQRLQEISGVAAQLEMLLQQLRDEHGQLSQRLRVIDSALGTSSATGETLPDAALRGRHLREVTVDVLRQRVPAGEPIHYREWLQLLSEAGLRVGGRDPHATFLTQISQAADVESVRPRSGLYRLRVA